MGKRNSPLFHAFFFAVSVIVMVYSGEQVSRLHNNPMLWVMKCSAVCSAFSIIAMGISFFFGSLSEKSQSKAISVHSELSELYSYEGKPLTTLERNTVLNIQNLSITWEYFAFKQNIYHVISYGLTILSLLGLMGATLLFGIGVYYE